ncbi:MAG: DUF4129 domain-containing protein [Acidobacteria bacterium]|nr:DUF4129 domain-containing protein [Acidobacteriota bacterium]
MNRLRTLLGVLALGLISTPAAYSQQAHDAPVIDVPEWPGPDDADIDSTTAENTDDALVTDLALVDRAHAAYLKDSELQLVRPEQDIDIPPPKPPPSWLKAIADFLQALGPVFQFVFWAAVVLIVAGLLYFIFGEAIRLRFGGRQKNKVKAEDDVLQDLRPDAAAARSLLDEADALARQGRFAEAVHLLLFRSIEDIQDRVEGGVPTSLTAREIAGLGKLPERAKRGLRPIIQVVERSFFGGRPVDAAGWQEARQSYEDFAFGEGWA